MGCRQAPSEPRLREPRVREPTTRGVRSLATVRALALAGLALAFMPAGVAHSQDRGAAAKTDTVKAGSDAEKPKMLVEADQLVQNTDKNTVSAEGNVRIYYDGRTLEADKVIYDKATKRLLATGHAKLTERDGTIYHGDQFDLTDDFRDGFVESLRADTKDKTHFSAPRMERIGGDTVFAKGTYTACEACADHPERPPLWRIRAKKIIHKDDERMIYYEGADLEFLGIPVAYTPFLSAPDPTVTKKSGVLSPHTLYKSQLGYGVGVPIFYNLSPDYDLTLTPTTFTKQAFFA